LTSTKDFVYASTMASHQQKRMPKPTPGELEILTVLWRLGPATVRSVHDELSHAGAVGYTTVLKLLQIMVEKGLVERADSEGRAHVYRPVIQRDDTQRQLMRDLVDRVFGGSAAQLVLRALSERPASREELREIRKMVEGLEKEAKK
jgi:BlaI family transcriptional regulator, penicillinase repressor